MGRVNGTVVGEFEDDTDTIGFIVKTPQKKQTDVFYEQ